MSILAVADLHLDEKRPERFMVFEDLVKSIDKHKAKAVLFLGDLTHIKDRHSAAFLNQVVDRVKYLADHAPVYLLAGNHDKLTAGTAFYSFLSLIKAKHQIKMIVETETHFIDGHKISFVPYGCQPRSDGRAVDIMCLHDSFNGARLENDQKIDDVLDRKMKIHNEDCTAKLYLAGHIHLPQEIKSANGGPSLHYVGSPFDTKYVPFLKRKRRFMIIEEDLSCKDCHDGIDYPRFISIDYLRLNDFLAQGHLRKCDNIAINWWVKDKTAFKNVEGEQIEKIKQKIEMARGLSPDRFKEMQGRCEIRLKDNNEVTQISSIPQNFDPVSLFNNYVKEEKLDSKDSYCSYGQKVLKDVMSAGEGQ